jgi:hypothetical protein
MAKEGFSIHGSAVKSRLPDPRQKAKNSSVCPNDQCSLDTGENLF